MFEKYNRKRYRLKSNLFKYNKIFKQLYQDKFSSLQRFSQLKIGIRKQKKLKGFIQENKFNYCEKKTKVSVEKHKQNNSQLFNFSHNKYQLRGNN